MQTDSLIRAGIDRSTLFFCLTHEFSYHNTDNSCTFLNAPGRRKCQICGCSASKAPSLATTTTTSRRRSTYSSSDDDSDY